MYRLHGSIGGITVLGVAHESQDATIISTPETLEKTGNDDIIMTSSLMTSLL